MKTIGYHPIPPTSKILLPKNSISITFHIYIYNHIYLSILFGAFTTATPCRRLHWCIRAWTSMDRAAPFNLEQPSRNSSMLTCDCTTGRHQLVKVWKLWGVICVTFFAKTQLFMVLHSFVPKRQWSGDLFIGDFTQLFEAPRCPQPFQTNWNQWATWGNPPSFHSSESHSNGPRYPKILPANGYGTCWWEVVNDLHLFCHVR